MDYDFTTIATSISPITQLAWIARSLHIDRTIQQFLAQYPSTVIANLGWGLDTSFERVDNGTLRWYDLDLPDVIELRSHYIQQRSRRHFIAGSILDDQWMELIGAGRPVLLVAAGVHDPRANTESARQLSTTVPIPCARVMRPVQVALTRCLYFVVQPDLTDNDRLV